jgi:hypothetical protein
MTDLCLSGILGRGISISRYLQRDRCHEIETGRREAVLGGDAGDGTRMLRARIRDNRHQCPRLAKRLTRGRAQEDASRGFAMKLKSVSARLLVGFGLALGQIAFGAGTAYAAHGAPSAELHRSAASSARAPRSDEYYWPGGPFGPYTPTPQRTDPSYEGSGEATWPPTGAAWPPGGAGTSAPGSQRPIVMPSSQPAPPTTSPHNR